MFVFGIAIEEIQRSNFSSINVINSLLLLLNFVQFSSNVKHKYENSIINIKNSALLGVQAFTVFPDQFVRQFVFQNRMTVKEYPCTVFNEQRSDCSSVIVVRIYSSYWIIRMPCMLHRICLQCVCVQPLLFTIRYLLPIVNKFEVTTSYIKG